MSASQIKTIRWASFAAAGPVGPPRDWETLEGKPPAFPPAAHMHAAAQISDSGAAGRSLLSSESERAAKAAIHADHCLDVRDFGAVGDGVADDTPAVQAAIDAAASGEGGRIVFFQGNRTYLITDTLIWKPGVSWRGGYGGRWVHQRMPELSWAGESGKNFIETVWRPPDENGFTNEHFIFMEGLCLRSADVNATMFHHGVVFRNRGDMGTWFRKMMIRHGTGNGIRFEQGGLNVHLRDIRWDTLFGHAIHWKLLTSDSLSVDGWTWDNHVDDLAPYGGGFIYVDGTTSGDNQRLSLMLSNGKGETNSNLAPGDGMIHIATRPSEISRVQVEMTCINVKNFPGAGVTNATGIQVSPSSDMVNLVLENCDLSIAGIPSWNDATRLSSSSKHIMTVIAPHAPSRQSHPASTRDAMEIFADVNFHNPLNFEGKRVGRIIHSTVADLPPGTVLREGDMLLDPAQIGLRQRRFQEVYSSGVVGTLAGVTASGAAGQMTLDVNSTAGLRNGQVIQFGGQSRRIIYVDALEMKIEVNLALVSTVSDVPVDYVAPQFWEFSFPGFWPAPPASGSHGRGSLILNNSVNVGAPSGWVNRTAGGNNWETMGPAGTDFADNGSPEGVVTAPVGSTFRRLDGGAGTTLYTKESGGNTGWKPVRTDLPFARVKTAGTTRANSDSFAADPDLAIASLPVGRYRVELGFQTYDNNNGGMKYQFGGTATRSALMRGTGQVLGTAPTQWGQIAAPLAGESVAPWANNTRSVRVDFTINVTVAGSFALEWAQHTSHATGTQLFAGAYMILTPLS